MSYRAERLRAESMQELQELLNNGGRISDRDEPNRQDNNVRASRAALALVTYAERVGGGGEEPETNLTDLLADIMHLCDALDIDFDTTAVRASRHYFAEALNGEAYGVSYGKGE
jgi:hypothetical protein